MAASDAMRKKEAIAWAGSASELARRLGINRQAVTKWSSYKPIPRLREYQIREMQARDVNVMPLDGHRDSAQSRQLTG